MTVSALLSKLGGRTPRFVTINGVVVSGAIAAPNGNGHVHPVHGHVTPVAPHTFHGGDDPPATTPTTAWWDTEPAAAAAERAAMSTSFPAFTEVERDGRRGWTGPLDTGHGKFLVEILHWPDKSLPTIEVLRPRRLERPAGRRMVRSPHLYDSGLICVADRADWHPDRHDAVTVVAWAAHWLAAYTEWRITLRWPAEGTPGAAA